MMKKIYILMCVLLTTGLGLSSCEKVVFDEADAEESKTEEKAGRGNLTLRVSGFNIVPFDTRTETDLTEYFKRLMFVVYQDGKKIDSRTQQQGDANYGKVTMSLEPGTYKLLVLGHNCSSNPTVSNPESIHFTNATGYNDTFYSYSDITVTEEATTHDITMKRAATMLRFIVNDKFPDNVKYFQFEYTGGSGRFNAVTGYGSNVNSQQVYLVNISSITTFPAPIRVYTFLQEDTGYLQLDVKALAEDQKTVIASRSFTDIPMKHTMVTEFSGTFFSHASDNSFSLTGNTDWGIYTQQTY